jgi:predicted DNA-binding transcriptional regulator AlpA
VATEGKMEFSDWIYEQYYEWRGSSRSSINQYASYLGVSQSAIWNWIHHSRQAPSGYNVIAAIAHRYPEIYKILELPLPYSEEIQQIAEAWADLTESDRARILDIALKPKDTME